MIEPFGEILRQYNPGLRELGFHTVIEQNHCHAFASKHIRIEFSIDRYVPAEILMSFVGNRSERYPCWQIRQLIDMHGYSLDKRKLNRIKGHYGLRDGAKGRSLFNSGVKIYTSTYLEQSLRFLSQFESVIDVDAPVFKKRLLKPEYG